MITHTQGQRVTKAEPFRFRTPQESTMGRQLTTEERAFLEEQKHAYKRHTVRVVWVFVMVTQTSADN